MISKINDFFHRVKEMAPLETEVQLGGSNETVKVQGIFAFAKRLGTMIFSGFCLRYDDFFGGWNKLKDRVKGNRHVLGNKDSHLVRRDHNMFSGHKTPPYVLTASESLVAFAMRIFHISKATAISTIGGFMSYLAKPGIYLGTYTVKVVDLGDEYDGDFFVSEKIAALGSAFQGWAIPAESKSIYLKGRAICGHIIHKTFGPEYDIIAPLNSTKFAEPGVYKVHLYFTKVEYAKDSASVPLSLLERCEMTVKSVDYCISLFIRKMNSFLRKLKTPAVFSESIAKTGFLADKSQRDLSAKISSGSIGIKELTSLAKGKLRLAFKRVKVPGFWIPVSTISMSEIKHEHGIYLPTLMWDKETNSVVEIIYPESYKVGRYIGAWRVPIASPSSGQNLRILGFTPGMVAYVSGKMLARDMQGDSDDHIFISRLISFASNIVGTLTKTPALVDMTEDERYGNVAKSKLMLGIVDNLITFSLYMGIDKDHLFKVCGNALQAVAQAVKKALHIPSGDEIVSDLHLIGVEEDDAFMFRTGMMTLEEMLNFLANPIVHGNSKTAKLWRAIFNGIEVSIPEWVHCADRPVLNRNKIRDTKSIKIDHASGTIGGLWNTISDWITSEWKKLPRTKHLWDDYEGALLDRFSSRFAELPRDVRRHLTYMIATSKLFVGFREISVDMLEAISSPTVHNDLMSFCAVAEYQDGCTVPAHWPFRPRTAVKSISSLSKQQREELRLSKGIHIKDYYYLIESTTTMSIYDHTTASTCKIVDDKIVFYLQLLMDSINRPWNQKIRNNALSFDMNMLNDEHVGGWFNVISTGKYTICGKVTRNGKITFTLNRPGKFGLIKLFSELQEMSIPC